MKAHWMSLYSHLYVGLKTTSGEGSGVVAGVGVTVFSMGMKSGEVGTGFAVAAGVGLVTVVGDGSAV